MKKYVFTNLHLITGPDKFGESSPAEARTLYTGQTPLIRGEACWKHREPVRKTLEEIRQAFLWSDVRTVTKTGTVSLHSNTYEVDPRLAGTRVELIYDPFDLDGKVTVNYHHGHAAGQPKVLKTGRHVHSKVNSAVKDNDASTSISAGINYLDLVTTRHRESLTAATDQLRRPPREHRAENRGHPMSSISTLQSHFGFIRLPFGRAVPPTALTQHPGHREAVARIRWCIDERRIGVIAGEVGAGKTVAARAALDQLEPSRHQIIYIPDPTIGIRGIRSAIVTALGATPSFFSGALAAQASSLLAGELDERSRLPVILIDEAHLLSVEDLEALRMLSNVRMDTKSHFALLLIGQPTLRRQLKMAVLSALDQRIGTRFTIGPMNLEDTTDYIKGHLGFAGRADPLFSEDDVKVIHQASRGYPRTVNNFALAALMATRSMQGAIVDQSAAHSAVSEFTE